MHCVLVTLKVLAPIPNYSKISGHLSLIWNVSNPISPIPMRLTHLKSVKSRSAGMSHPWTCCAVVLVLACDATSALPELLTNSLVLNAPGSMHLPPRSMHLPHCLFVVTCRSPRTLQVVSKKAGAAAGQGTKKRAESMIVVCNWGRSILIQSDTMCTICWYNTHMSHACIIQCVRTDTA